MTPKQQQQQQQQQLITIDNWENQNSSVMQNPINTNVVVTNMGWNEKNINHENEKDIKKENTTDNKIVEKNDEKKDKKEPKIEKKSDKNAIDPLKRFIILSKWQIYSFLRRWYITWIKLDDNDPIINEKFVNDNIIYVFNSKNLPLIQWKKDEKNKYDIILEIWLDENTPYIVKSKTWTVWICGFLPIVSIKKILFATESEKQDFENPVPNANDNFVIPHEICSVDENVFEECKNEFSYSQFEVTGIDEIIWKINNYNRLLWAFFFANYWAYVNNTNDNYSKEFIQFLSKSYTKLPKQLTSNPESEESNGRMFRLAYEWIFSYIDNMEKLISTLLENNIINLTDRKYITTNYKSTSWFVDFWTFFKYKKSSSDDITWQIISYLIEFCSNSSSEEKCLELSNSIMWKFKDSEIKVSALFVLWLCCWYADVVCEMGGNEDELIKQWKKKFKDWFTPLRARIITDVFNFVVKWKDFNELDIKDIAERKVEYLDDCVIATQEKNICWEKCIINEKRVYWEYYLLKIKKMYWEDLNNLNNTYFWSYLNKNNLEKISNFKARNEELDKILELDSKYNFNS